MIVFLELPLAVESLISCQVMNVKAYKPTEISLHSRVSPLMRSSFKACVVEAELHQDLRRSNNRYMHL